MIDITATIEKRTVTILITGHEIIKDNETCARVTTAFECFRNVLLDHHLQTYQRMGVSFLHVSRNTFSEAMIEHMLFYFQSLCELYPNTIKMNYTGEEFNGKIYQNSQTDSVATTV